MRWLVFILFFGGFAALAAPFRNLGFEEANTNNVTSWLFDARQGWGTTADLLPGWQLFAGSRPVTTIGFNLYETQIIGEASDLFTRGYVDFFLPMESTLSLSLLHNRVRTTPWCNMATSRPMPDS
jgi:hypothetical protein